MGSYLITGASRGLGLELTRQLASFPSSEVRSIYATARGDAPSLVELANDSSSRVIIIKLDVTSEASIKQAAAEVEANLNGKGLDVLINNAGIMQYSPKGVGEM
jgi:NAD(P)-dependent dehydrogenase (short-subunit alcohol dehydrogenase family)